MDAELEALVARAQDPVLIPGIYNYCDRRCERCAFTQRCFSFREEQEQQRRHGHRDLSEHVESNFQLCADLMRAWCEREGIDFEQIQDEAQSEAAVAEAERRREAIEHDSLHTSARRYTNAAYDLVEPLKQLSPFHEWPRGVAEAIDTIAWHAGLIAAKISRALHGLAEQGRCVDDDPIQNDWNGSAKVARLAIAETQAAWKTLFAAGETPPDAPIRETAALLAEIDGKLAERFPRALDFIRPGFDEPDVAAGAPTSLAPFEPRHRSFGQRVRAWLARIGLGRRRI